MNQLGGLAATLLFLLTGTALADEPRAKFDPVAQMKSDREAWRARSPLQEIPPPPEAVLHGGGGSSGAAYDEWNQRIETAEGPREVLAYYVEALAARGWKLGTVTVDRSVALVTGRATLEGGEEWHVLLMAARSPAAERQVELMLRLTRFVEAP